MHMLIIHPRRSKRIRRRARAVLAAKIFAIVFYVAVFIVLTYITVINARVSNDIVACEPEQIQTVERVKMHSAAQRWDWSLPRPYESKS